MMDRVNPALWVGGHQGTSQRAAGKGNSYPNFPLVAKLLLGGCNA